MLCNAYKPIHTHMHTHISKVCKTSCPSQKKTVFPCVSLFSCLPVGSNQRKPAYLAVALKQAQEMSGRSRAGGGLSMHFLNGLAREYQARPITASNHRLQPMRSHLTSGSQPEDDII